jgi:phage baseplate assembly protein W
MIFAPKFPLSFDDTDGFQNVDSLKELVLFHLKNLLLTNRGEKISDPNYGVGIKRFLFELETVDIESSVETAISDQISVYLSYLNVRDIQVSLNNQEMRIAIKYTTSGISEVQMLNLTIASSSGQVSIDSTASY